jgi:hypothetical protein
MNFRIANITFDCSDALKLAQFWSTVLDRPVDEGGSDAFASIGGADVQRNEPAWYFNKVDESKVVKNRVHLDLVNPDPAAIPQLVSHGATVVEQIDWGFHGWTVLKDPQGNEFCVAAKAFEDRS